LADVALRRRGGFYFTQETAGEMAGSFVLKAGVKTDWWALFILDNGEIYDFSPTEAFLPSVRFEPVTFGSKSADTIRRAQCE
jgi:hypothetical protein